jgi:hypothetical protein
MHQRKWLPTVIIACVLAPMAFGATSYTYVGANGGAWETAANWSPNTGGFPGSASGDSATVNGAAGNPTINATPANTLASISISGNALINIAASVTLTATATTLNQGKFTGSTGTFAIPSGGTLTSNHTTSNDIDCQVSNAGSITVSTGRLNFFRSVVNTGSVTATAANTIASIIGNASPVFQNNTTGTITGKFVVDTNAILQINNTLTFSGTLQFDGNSGNAMNGSGSLTLTSGSALNIFAGLNSWSLPTTTINSGATWSFAHGVNTDGSLPLITNAVITCNGSLSMAASTTMNIASGCTVTCSGAVTIDQLSGVFGINGGGTFALTATGTLTSTHASGSNKIIANFTNAGTVTASTGRLELNKGVNTGALNGTGGTIVFINNVTTCNAPATLSGSILVDTNATLTINNAISLTGTLQFDGNSGNALTGSGSLAITGNLNIFTNISTWSLPTVTVASGSTWAFAHGVNQDGGVTLSGNSAITCNGTLSMPGFFRISINTGSTVTCSGAVNIDQINTINGVGTFALTSTATLTSTHATATNNITAVFTNAGTVKSNTGTLNVGGSFVQTAGSLQLNGGNLSSTGPIVLNGGTLVGAGTITGNVTNNTGTVSPGFSPGKITISGNYTQNANGTLNLELGGPLPSQIDNLTVSGTATLGGGLSVSLINSFVPNPTDMFDVLTPGNRVGTFATFNNNGTQSTLDYSNPTNVRVLGGTPYPVPVLSSLVPPSLPAGTKDSALRIFGSSFFSASKVRWNGQDRITIFSSSTELVVLIPAADLAAVGTSSVTVFNPAPAGGTSAAQTFTIGSSGGGITTPTPTATDTDGDGFSDAIEAVAGTSKTDPTSKPVGGAAADSPLPVPDVKLAIKLNFAKANSDSLTLSGTLLTSEGFQASGQEVIVAVGGLARKFTLDGKGAGTADGGSIKVAVKGSAASIAKYAVKLSKTTLAAELASTGLTNSTTSAKVDVPLMIVFDGKVYKKTQTVEYKATAGKSGSAK